MPKEKHSDTDAKKNNDTFAQKHIVIHIPKENTVLQMPKTQ